MDSIRIYIPTDDPKVSKQVKSLEEFEQWLVSLPHEGKIFHSANLNEHSVSGDYVIYLDPIKEN